MMATSLPPILPLHRQDCVTLDQILHLFSAPITEEQAWAIIHQAVSCLHHLQTQTDLYLMQKPGEFIISREGLVHPDTFTRPDIGRLEMTSHISAVVEIASVVYSALDFGVAEDEERTLSDGLDNLINVMVEQQSSKIAAMDDSEDILSRVLDLCKHHLSLSEEADSHYRAVCKALVSEAMELAQPMCDTDLQVVHHEDWSYGWSQVMLELTGGIRLKSVNYNHCPVEYKMTPYEMLMDDLRNKNYKLSPAPSNTMVTTHVRERMLEFIRSRPPLKPVKDRHLKEKKVEEKNVQECLLNDIRGSKARQSLRKTPTREAQIYIDIAEDKLNNSRDLSVIYQPKKVIDMDKSFADHILNFEETMIVSPSPSPRISPDLTNDLELEEAAPRVNLNENLNSTYFNSRRSTISEIAIDLPSTSKCMYDDWVNRLNTLDLNLEEVSHMRFSMTKAELEEMDLNPKDRADCEKSKLCFVCRNVRFNIFHWSYSCEFCKRSVCAKCCAKIRLPADKLKQIPVCCLGKQLDHLGKKEIEAVNGALAGLVRSWERRSLRGQTGRLRERQEIIGETDQSYRPKLQRARTMDKGDRDKLREIQGDLETGRGSRHNICVNCKDLLASIVRRQRQTDTTKVERMKRSKWR